MQKIILSADGACDIGPELVKQYKVEMVSYHIQIGEESYRDMIDIQPDDLYRAWREQGILPKTAAVTPEEYREKFQQWVNEGYEVIHIGLGSGITSSYQNCLTAAEAVGHVYPVDSRNLSTGMGHLVRQAGIMIAQGLPTAEIQHQLTRMTDRVQTSFVVDTLEFLKAGGRCSSLAAFGAGVLNIKPCIEVDREQCGAMNVGRKYRGSIDKVLKRYVQDRLEGCQKLDEDCLFITHSGSPQSDIELVREEVARYADFKNIYVTRASGTISTHCGPRTLGILYMTKE